MAPNSSSTRRSSDLRNLAYARLKRMIVTARLRPGAYLVERDLAAELGISRTPVREAIARLAAEGLILRRRRRGYLVAAMDPKQVAGLYAVREALEALAVHLAVGRMGSAGLRQLEVVAEAVGAAARTPGGNASGRRPGLRVHDLIVRHSGNPFLYETWRRLIEKILPYVWIETLYADDIAQTLHEHRQLCRHIRTRNTVAAEQLIRKHIGRARDNLMRVLTLQVGGDLPVNSRSRDGHSVRRGSRPRPVARGGRG